MTTTRHRGLLRVTAPAAEPLTLSETKEFLRVPHNDDDARIADIIITARTLAEQWLKRALVTQTWKLIFEDCLDSGARLPMGPVQSITSLTAIDAGGNAQLIDPSMYALSANSETLALLNSIFSTRIELVYVTGYGTASQLPKPIKLGMLQHVSAIYDGQASLAPIPDSVLQFYMPFKEFSL